MSELTYHIASIADLQAHMQTAWRMAGKGLEAVNLSDEDLLKELLHYDPATGIFTWNHRGAHWFATRRSCSVFNKQFSGKTAGCELVDSNGYKSIAIKIFGKRHKAHRLAWLYMEGMPIPDEIDHINRDATDNRWVNLRASTRNDNQRNRNMRKDNSSGVTGVNWHKSIGKWRAYCRIGKRQHSIGYFNREDLDLAAMEVLEFRADNGFSPHHGLELARYHCEVSS